MPPLDADQSFVFTPPVAAGTATPLASEAQREMAQIVRQVAAAVGSPMDVRQYAALIVDCVFRGIQPAGVILWRYPTPADDQSPIPLPKSLRAMRRCGGHTDRSIPKADKAVHRRLIVEVIGNGSPVVVPPDPTGDDDKSLHQRAPSDTDVATGRNPSTMAAAIVPVPIPHPIDHGYVIEVFLGGDEPAVVWKGYLRMVAQLADLAGQYFAIEHLKRLTRTGDYTASINAITAAARIDASAAQTREQFIDLIATRFDFRRVAWIDVSPLQRPQITAVSHCPTVDPRAAGTRAMVQIAAIALGQDDETSGWVVPDADGGGTGFVMIAVSGAKSGLLIETEIDDDTIEIARSGGDDADAPMLPIAVDHLIDAAFVPPLTAGLSHIDHLSSATERLERIPLGRFLSSGSTSRRSRRVMVAIALAFIAMMLAFCPMPQNVLATITLRPSQERTIACTRDCVVESIDVTDGQFVPPQTVLAHLRDPELDERRVALAGERDVLREKKLVVSGQLVDPRTPRSEYQKLEDDQVLVETQLEGIESELQSIDRMIDALTIRSKRTGRIDGWQLLSELPGRPMRRGQALMRLIPEQAEWLAMARVPRRRLDTIYAANARGELSASITIDGSPSRPRAVRLNRFGPPVQTPVGDEHSPLVWVEFQLCGDHGNSDLRTSDLRTSGHGTLPDDPAWRRDAPGRVMIYCGDVSLGHWFAADAIRWARLQTAIWLGLWR